VPIYPKVIHNERFVKNMPVNVGKQPKGLKDIKFLTGSRSTGNFSLFSKQQKMVRKLNRGDKNNRSGQKSIRMQRKFITSPVLLVNGLNRLTTTSLLVPMKSTLGQLNNRQHPKRKVTDVETLDMLNAKIKKFEVSF